jgi:hypothetical protein
VVFRSFCISNEICSGLKISIKDKFQNMMTGEIWTLYKSVIIDLKIEDII